MLLSLNIGGVTENTILQLTRIIKKFVAISGNIRIHTVLQDLSVYSITRNRTR